MPHALANASRSNFTRQVERRGDSYFSRCSVVQLKGDSQQVTACVQGSEKYNVSLRWQDTNLNVSCTCAHFEDGHLCKHIWAVVRAADAKAFLLPLPTGAVEVVPERKTRSMPRHSESDQRRSDSSWRSMFDAAEGREKSPQSTAPETRNESFISYVLMAPPSHQSNDDALLSAFVRSRKKDGGLSKEKALILNRAEIAALPDDADRRILGILSGSDHRWEGFAGLKANFTERRMTPILYDLLLPDLCESGRLTIEVEGVRSATLRMDQAAAWTFELTVSRDARDDYRIGGILQNGDARVDVSDPLLILQSGWIFWNDHVARLDHGDGYSWIQTLRRHGPIVVPQKHGEELLNRLAGRKGRHGIVLPPDLAWTEQDGKPRPIATIVSNQRFQLMLNARLDFEYAGAKITPEKEERLIETASRSFIRRDLAAEKQAAADFQEAGFLPSSHFMTSNGFPYEIVTSRLGSAARTLLSKGWDVKAEGKSYRQPGSMKLNVTTGLDWFELHGGVEFDGKVVPLPDILNALKNRQTYVTLGDGTVGLLPEEWLQRFGTFAAAGEAEEDHIRFKRSQAGLLDTLLAAQPEIRFDEGFGRIRDELHRFSAIEATNAPEGFQGVLREYQREGLGWFGFLQRFGFGGCLADDMGLGKTVQVLALLESRRLLRRSKSPPPPSLVVMPRSLVFNWKREAERFTPEIRILDHTGIARAKSTGHLQDYDVVLTTYGTLRRDAALLKDVEFDYVILDEAQAIKNADSLSAKASRLLNGRHRLAMSGTPIENHLGELWSLLQFLNPGLLGSLTAFRDMSPMDGAPADLSLLSQALRPFILRRTKAEVAKDLPERQEETLYCELPDKQRKLYEDLRAHYRGSLLGIVDTQGLKKSKIMILEALLRLRQAACHPGLLDPAAAKDESAKLSLLVPQLHEIASEGHKTLVFSQFVKFLDLLKKDLDGSGIRYAYLDGKTRDREARVQEFQNDPDCKLFLISLKAGGLGLNLTAAEYVYLLDPWWNPAVEAQAIDRAHRIGQTQKVFAYRIIAKDTIEEKVLELQKRKRELADSIINADNSLIRNITREDLELLLG